MQNRSIAAMAAQRASSADEPRTLAAVHDRHLPAIQPLTARSVVLSTLLGYHPPELPVRALVRVGGLFDIAERSIRVALSRMVADGDLLAENGTYRLTERLVRRQAQQEDSASPRSKPWTGDWAMAVVTSSARPLADRVALRKQMVDLRHAELREGVWIRPDNLIHRIDDLVVDQCTFFTCQYADEHDLVQRLWNLPAWADTARHLDAALDQATSLKSGFMWIAEAVRHLRIDPCLPPELLSGDWPGLRLRERYATFRDQFAQRLRDYSTS
jgi:phenylacetic acid degradation operon negative regulatory protein